MEAHVKHSYDFSDSLSHHSSVQGESDSEPEGYLHNMTHKLGSIFSSDSSDADVSDNEDIDDLNDATSDKPVFITSRGPVDAYAGGDVVDVVVVVAVVVTGCCLLVVNIFNGFPPCFYAHLLVRI